MRLNNRLRRLEGAFGGRDEGCPACRERRDCIVMVTSVRLLDGTTAPEGEWPAPCDQCGEVPEQIIELTEAVVEGREDVARREEVWTAPG